MVTESQENNKRIVFTDNVHRHAKFLIRLQYDGLTQSDFFRKIITGYLDNDGDIVNFIDGVKGQSQRRRSKSKKLIQQGIQKKKSLGLNDQELIDDLFDLIAEEHPDL